jgi:protein subunit release factor A
MIIEIRPGEGGDDAKLFMRDLAAAYTTYLDRKG